MREKWGRLPISPFLKYEKWRNRLTTPFFLDWDIIRVSEAFPMNGRFMLAVIAAGLLFLPALLMAHNSVAAYESTKQITVTGTVMEFHFVNPHVLIYMTVKDESGTTRKWQGELASPNRLVRVGWNTDITETGDPIALTGYPAKDGGNSIRLTKVVLKGHPLASDLE
jgi:hypothetical protein